MGGVLGQIAVIQQLFQRCAAPVSPQRRQAAADAANRPAVCFDLPGVA
jgi:hypothetical protein